MLMSTGPKLIKDGKHQQLLRFHRILKHIEVNNYVWESNKEHFVFPNRLVFMHRCQLYCAAVLGGSASGGQNSWFLRAASKYH